MGWRHQLLGAAVAAGLATAAFAAADKPQALADGVWLIAGGFAPGRQPDGNTVVFDAGRSLVVMDTGRHAAQRDAILAFAARRREPITAVINSHWHLDHVSGNLALRAAYPRLRVYASGAIDEALTGFLARSAVQGRTALDGGKLPPDLAEDVRGDLATVEAGEALKPDMVVTRSGPARFGPLRLRLNLAPRAATAGDIWVYDPKHRLVAAGDLVTLPAAFLDTACPAGWRAALAVIDATPFEVLVPGHGAPMSHDGFRAYRHAFDGLVDCAASDAGKAACAERWVADLGALLPADQATQAWRMTAYYVESVLRAEPARQACAAGPALRQ